MRLEPALKNNIAKNDPPWIPNDNKSIIFERSGAYTSSSSVHASSSSSKQYPPGARFVPELSFKTKSGTPGDSKSITPEKDVTMDDSNDEGSSAHAVDSDEEEGEEGGRGREDDDGDDAAATATGANPLDVFMEAVELRAGKKATDDDDDGAATGAKNDAPPGEDKFGGTKSRGGEKFEGGGGGGRMATARGNPMMPRGGESRRRTGKIRRESRPRPWRILIPS